MSAPAVDYVDDFIFGEDEPELPEPSATFIDVSLIAGANGELGAEAVRPAGGHPRGRRRGPCGARP